VRITSIGCAEAGNASSAAFSDAGRPRRDFSLVLVAFQFRGGGQFAMHQQVGDFFKLAGVGDVEDVVAAIVQVVAGLADGAQCGIAGGDAGQGDGFFWFEGACFGHFAGSPVSGFLVSWAFCAANSASSFCSKLW
jgi:hypothetical protein